MIGLYALWHDPDAVLPRASAFATAFRTDQGLPVAGMANGVLLCDGHAAPGQDHTRTPDGSVVLLYGFIENRARWRSELDVRAPGDAAIYAAAYARWGEDADQHLTGEYATILVEPNGRRIRLARSPVKSPALYYRHDPERLIATTAVQAIFSTGEIPRELDEQKIADTLYLNYREERRSWFQGVTRLPRGSRAWITPDGVQETCFFRIEDIPPVRLRRDSDYVEAADALFREATEAALEGFERPAISLSGGLDSQAVAAYAMLARPDRPLLSYTSVPDSAWVPPDPGAMVNERPHVEALAAMYPELKPTWIGSEGRYLSHFQREMFETSLTSPRNGANLHWIHDVRVAARDAGADVLLNGNQGNLTFSYNGRGLLQDMVRQGRFMRLGRELLHGGPVMRLPVRAAREVVLPFLPGHLQGWIRRHMGKLEKSPFDSWSPLDREFARDMDVDRRARELGFDPDFSPVRSVLDFRLRMMGNAANEGGDISYAMDRLHGIPSRDPTRYRPLLEFCLAIPPEQYLFKGQKRWLAQRMLRGKVPEMVLRERRKGRQSADWARRIRSQRAGILSELDWLSSDPLVARYMDFERLQNAVRDMPDDERDLTEEQARTLSLALTRALTTARFVRFINGRNDI
jgi:asparagine synthase (glutamine-hydrolysing)